MDGTPLSPDEVFAAPVVGTVRRVVMDAASVVIDLGRKRRFTGAAASGAAAAEPDLRVRRMHHQVDVRTG
ncbi:MAG: hypothetical protein R2705_21715 [Ilumatobacteraceae bacterium]